ncbi:MAG TPA: phage tail tape measure protein [Pseudomonas sp.]|uniref:phage tail tape measure protein n=1 Tax=Pseudomonas sp. TaxID=306 RepID=UPI002EDB3197
MANSLGTLTLDLVAKIGAFTGPLDQASQTAKKRNAEISKSFASLAAGVGVALGSIPAVLTGLVVSSANAAKEISNQATLAGLGTTEFQKYAAGARTVGVEQDKLADIFKDTNDKLGDFANTGGGALKDFFTNIAPMVGVTADQFKKLNSKDALALYVTSLEKANVSQQEMTFYMEAIANDSTALVPLLRNGGKGFDELGAAAEAAGVILDGPTIAAAKQFGIEVQGLQQYLSSAQAMLAAEFLPVLAQFAKDVNQSAKDAGGLKGVVGDLGEKLVETTAFVVSAGDGVTRVFDIVANTLVGLYATAVGHLSSLMSDLATGMSKITFGDTAKQFVADSARLRDEASTNFNVAAQAAAAIGENLDKPLAGDQFKEYVANAKKAAAELAKTNQSTTPGTGSGVDPAAMAAQAAAQKKAASDSAAAAKKIQDAFKTTETDYQRQIELINTTTDAQKDATEADKLHFEIASGKLVGINAEQQKRLEGLASEMDRLEKLKKSNEDLAAVEAFRLNANQETHQIKDSLDLDLAGAGQGDKQKERRRKFLEIDQNYFGEVDKLWQQFNSKDITKERYDQETEIAKEAYAQRIIDQQDHYNQQDEAQNKWLDGVSAAWQNYADTAQNYTQMAADLTSSTLDNASSSLSTFLSDVATGSEDAGDALADMVSGFAKSTISALADMAAQWLVYQAVQLVVGKTGQSSAALGLIANAQAASFAAQVNAYASTAAIPVFGPALAPAAALTAAVATAPMVAGVASAALSGMAHDGIDSVPETGTWLLQKGERVTTAETSAKLDRTLDRVSSGGGGGSSGSIKIDAPITVQAQPGMTDQQAQQQGESMGQAFTAEVIRIIQSETQQGGVLWRRTGG